MIVGALVAAGLVYAALLCVAAGVQTALSMVAPDLPDRLLADTLMLAWRHMLAAAAIGGALGLVMPGLPAAAAATLAAAGHLTIAYQTDRRRRAAV